MFITKVTVYSAGLHPGCNRANVVYLSISGAGESAAHPVWKLKLDYTYGVVHGDVVLYADLEIPLAIIKKPSLLIGHLGSLHPLWVLLQRLPHEIPAHAFSRAPWCASAEPL